MRTQPENRVPSRGPCAQWPPHTVSTCLRLGCWGLRSWECWSREPEGCPRMKREHLLQSCSMVAHCSDFFQVWASSSFRVRTASSSKLMLSCKAHRRVPEQPAVDGSYLSASAPASHTWEGMRNPHRPSL